MILIEMYEAQKLSLEDGTINFERSNQKAQKCRSSRPDQGKLKDQIKATNQISQMKRKLLNISKKIL